MWFSAAVVHRMRLASDLRLVLSPRFGVYAYDAAMDIGRVGVWAYQLDQVPVAKAQEHAVDADAARLKDGKEALLERMWSPTVHINGRIAVVWTRYDFHVNGKFTHSGTDCFTLLKTDQGWKIASCVYSVEPGAHTEHPAGPPK